VRSCLFSDCKNAGAHASSPADLTACGQIESQTGWKSNGSFAVSSARSMTVDNRFGICSARFTAPAFSFFRQARRLSDSTKFITASWLPADNQIKTFDQVSSAGPACLSTVGFRNVNRHLQKPTRQAAIGDHGRRAKWFSAARRRSSRDHIRIVNQVRCEPDGTQFTRTSFLKPERTAGGSDGRSKRVSGVSFSVGRASRLKKATRHFYRRHRYFSW